MINNILYDAFIIVHKAKGRPDTFPQKHNLWGFSKPSARLGGAQPTHQWTPDRIANAEGAAGRGVP